MFIDSNLLHMNIAADTMPKYMKENLENMTCDKGYIYKNVWFYGKKPIKYSSYKNRHQTNSKKQIMFKKINRNILHIYEITPSYIKILEKKYKENTTIEISFEKRIPIRNTVL